MNNQQLFEQASPLLEQLEQAGFEAYYVGGAVRDYLLDRPIGDVDIATSALPEEVKSVFPKTVDIGIDHGTVLVLWRGSGYEVTTFRTESDYKDFRRPEKVAFVRSLTEDLQRRDFTINAIAMDRHGRIIDPFHGQEAIKDKEIRTVGLAEERLTEDALRMMRAARFVSQLGFTLHPETASALASHASLLKHIAVERKLSEMNKLLDGTGKKAGIDILLQAGLFTYLPGLSGQSSVLRTALSLPVDPLTADQMWLLLILLIKPESAKDFLAGWRMPAKKIKYMIRTLQVLERRQQSDWTDFFLYEAGLPSALDAEAVFAALHNRKAETEALKARHCKLAIQDRSELAVTGSDLKEWKQEKGGPWMKEYLQIIERAVVDRKVNNSSGQIKEWLKSCNLL
ncbi:CCA tRNA nucleotidyltransferase [Bacillus xiapuensis]|uniref:CCA tRNA nucleotidyltransferase n=1 Tax=Bacillus xiapuensis TaxID=2014075 RepID=UPI000C250B7A|nr:CCA tRNA nucleotidyltransferase [Bacillus xiapuensis]